MKIKFQPIRRFFYETHLWLGIVSGIIVFLVCLSGSMLVFREEVAHLLEPSKYYVDVPKDKTRVPIDEILVKLEAANPGMKAASVSIPEKANRTITVTLSQPQGMGEGNGMMGRGQSGSSERGGMGRGNFERGNSERGNSERGNSERGNFERSGRPPRGEQNNNEPFGERREGQRRGRPDGQQGNPNAQTERGQGERPQGERGQRGQSGERGERRQESNASGQVAAGQGRPQGGGPGGRGGGKMLFVNPYTAEVVGEGMGNSADSFFRSMTGLHRNLWIDIPISESNRRKTWGGLIVGIATLVFVVVLLSGLVLWIPRTWKMLTKGIGFTIRFRRGVWIFLYDLHNTVGFYMLIPLLILALTGLCWSFSWYRDGASYLLGDQIFKQRMQRPEKIEPLPQLEKLTANNDENKSENHVASNEENKNVSNNEENKNVVNNDESKTENHVASNEENKNVTSNDENKNIANNEESKNVVSNDENKNVANNDENKTENHVANNNEKKTENSVASLKPLSVGEMIERQNKLTPGGGDLSISIPSDNETAMVIQKGHSGFFVLSARDKTQWDRFRGTVIPVEHHGKKVEVERFSDKPFGAKIATLVRSLHLGDVTGTSSKIFFFIICLFATTFPITGVALWVKKLRGRYKNRKLKAEEAKEKDKAEEKTAA